jgi:hypothetical protein
MIRRLLLLVAVATSFLVGYGVTTDALHNGPQPNRGYFTGIGPDFSGDDVWNPGVGPVDTPLYGSCRGANLAIPTAINSKSEFITFVKCKLTYGNQQERVGARFIIQTMREGLEHSAPSPSDITDWENRINNPDITVDWGGDNINRSWTLNSFYMGAGNSPNPVDDAFYNESGSSDYVIRFIYKGTQVKYMIRRACANPVGTLPGIPQNPPFNISGSSRVSATGVPEAQNISVTSGTSVTFRHRLTSNAATAQDIDWTTHTQTGALVSSGNAGTFAAGQTKIVGQQTFAATGPPGTVICRYVRWSPDTQVGGSSSTQAAQACVTIIEDYALSPSVEVRVNGAATNEAEPGDIISFVYTVNNTGGEALNMGCDIYGLTRVGYYNIPSPPDSVSDPGYTPPPGLPGCPRAFPGDTITTLGTETLPGASAVLNRSICRSLFVDHGTPGGAAVGREACAYVVHKPYTRAYGGDVTTGVNFESSPGTCTTYEDSAIIGWNRGSSNAWAGAGVQHAAMATGRIFDFASSLGGGAGPPTALSFANTSTNPGAGNFGGEFDWASCFPDFYSDRPATTTPIPAQVNLMNNDTYGGSGNITLGGGNLGPGERITVYVEGNVLITDSITYVGNWTVDNMPLFRLIVRGNIYIDRDVSQLDGLYVAQPDAGATQGAIYTCTNNAFSQPNLNGTFLTDCNNKLTVNGSFLARHVRLLRTAGTVGQSNAGETNGSANIAEVFNYNPSMWAWQPPTPGSANTYDSITSLPPIL